jgi:hypothetical protein
VLVDPKSIRITPDALGVKYKKNGKATVAKNN